MKRLLLSFSVAVLFLSNSFSQITFEEGYYIDDTGQRIECKIKNVDWKDNPTSFDYIEAENAEVKTARIDNTKEFGISGAARFIRAAVKIDRSSNNLNNMSVERNPVYNEEQLFLKVLVEGGASLYQYVEDNLTRFFYKIGDSGINPLVYKSYLIHNRIVSYNNHFRQQLLTEMNCPEIPMNIYETLGYNTRDLKKIFISYNTCINSEYVSFDNSKDRDQFNLIIRPGLNFSNLHIEHSNTELLTSAFEIDLSPKIGIEAEIVLPFNKNKWSILARPTFRTYKNSNTIETNEVVGGTLTSNVKYTSVELPVGLRHYFFLSEKSKVYLGASLIVDFVNDDSSISFLRADGSDLTESLTLSGRNSMGIEIGYKYNDKISIELGYQSGRDVLTKYVLWTSGFSAVSLTIGYSIF